MSTASTCNGIAMRAHSAEQKRAQSPEFGLMPWSTCTARNENAMSRASRARIERRTTESMPPERPATRCAPGDTAGAIAAATLSGSSLELGFLEFPITHQALEALLDELLGTLLGEPAQGIGERALETLRHRLRIAVRSAERLRDDLVDQAEGLQTARGD